ncbi:WhiB family transcriptional regulator [Cellulomonas sp. P5_C5]
MWQDRAACAGDPDAGRWFSIDPARVLAAVRVCASCPVVVACGEAGQDEHDGVWGGIPRTSSLAHALERALAAEAVESGGPARPPEWPRGCDLGR